MALKVGELFATLSLKTDQFNDALKGVASSSALKIAADIGQKMGQLIVQGIQSAVDAGSSFEAAMSQVAATMGTTVDQIDALTEKAKEMGATTKFSATEAAEGLNILAQAGLSADEQIAGIETVLNLASAGAMSMDAAASYVTATVKGFSDSMENAGKYADMMAKGATMANTSVAALGEAFSGSAASVSAYGQSAESTMLSLLKLAEQNVTGSEAANALNRAMQSVYAPTSTAQKALDKIGVSAFTATGEFKDFNDVIADVQAATASMSDAERASIINDIFGTFGSKAYNKMIKTTEGKAAEFEAGIADAAGSAAAQAETQLDNLQGDLAIMNSALEAVKITAYESFSGIARSAVQELSGLFDKINLGGKRGGIAGMFDAAIDEIPNLLPKATNAVGKLLKGIASKLPALAKKLVSALPSVIDSLGDMLPGLVEGIASGLSGLVDGLIENIPKILPALTKSIGKVLIAAINGAFKMLGGVFSGLESILKELGLIPKDFGDKAAQAFENADTSNIHLDTVSVEGEIDAKTYIEKVNQAKSDIEAALNSFNLSEDDYDKMYNAILRGSGAEALQAALEILDVPTDKADKYSQDLTYCMEQIQSVFDEQAPELTDEQRQSILDAVLSGTTDLQTALETIGGLSPEQAEKVAEEMQGHIDTIRSDLNALEAEGIDVSGLQSSLASGADGIVAALKLLGADDSEIQKLLGSIDTLAGTMSSRLNAAFTELKKSFTDGNLENDAEAATEGMVSLQEFNETAMTAIDEWETNALAQLQQMGLDEETLKTKTKEITDEAETLRSELDTIITESANWISDNAGAATDVVEKHFQTLDDLLSKAQNLEARLAELEGELDPKNYAIRNAVTRGNITNETLQAQAIQMTATERDAGMIKAEEQLAKDLQTAQDDYDKAIAKAADDLAKIGKDAPVELQQEAQNAYTEAMSAAANALSDASDKAQTDYDANVAKVNEQYQSMISAILVGIMASNKELQEGFKNSGIDFSAINVALMLQNALMETPEGEPFDLMATAEKLGISPEQIEALAKELGVSIDSLKSLDGIQFGALSLQLFGRSEKGVENVFSSLDPQNLADIITYMGEQGLLDGVEGIDFSDPEQALSDIWLKLLESPDLVGMLTGKTINIGTPEVTADGTPDTTPVQEEVVSAVEGQTYTAEVSLGVKLTSSPTLENMQIAKQIMDAIENSTDEEFSFDKIISDLGITPEKLSSLEKAMGLDEGTLKGLSGLQLDSSLFNFIDPEMLKENGNESGAMFAEGIVNGAEEGAEQVTAAGEGTGKALAGGAQSYLEEKSPSKVGVEIGEYFDQGIANGVTENTSSVTDAANALCASLVSAFEGTKGKLQDLFKGIFDGNPVEVPVVPVTPTETSTDTTVTNNVDVQTNVIGLDSLSGMMASNGLTAGHSFGDGFVRGMAERLSAVKSKAMELARAAVDELKRGIQQGSPSKITMESGRFFGEGFAIGIRDRVMEVKHAAKEMADTAAGMTQISGNFGGSGRIAMATANSSQIDYEQLADAVNSRPQTFNLNGKTVAQANAENTATAQNSRSRDIALRYGA